MAFNLAVLCAQAGIKRTINKTQNKLQLSAQIPGLVDGEHIYIRRWLDANTSRLEDSVQVKHGGFFYETHLENSPYFFWFEIRKHGKIIPIYLDNETVTIFSQENIDQMKGLNIFEYLTVNGSQLANQQVYEYGLERVWINARSKMNKSIRQVNPPYTKEKLEHLSALIDANDLVTQSVFAALQYPPVRSTTTHSFLLFPLQIQREFFWPLVYKLFDDSVKNSYYGRQMSDLLPLCNGNEAPNFNFQIDDGKISSLNEVYKKNKLTILHFWSNGSVERARIHHELSEVYQKYQNKGLEIVSVSLDANPDKWKKIIQEDKIPGYQTCDFKEEESPIAKLYKMDPKNTINILIDQNGKMIAWDVDGPKLFGYLYRIFGE
jgi:peroxiredoxin